MSSIMSGRDLSLEETAEVITNIILEEKFLNKEHLIKKLVPILALWTKKADKTKKLSASDEVIDKTIRSRDFARRFWLNKVRESCNNDTIIMQPLYDELDELMIKEGFKEK